MEASTARPLFTVGEHWKIHSEIYVVTEVNPDRVQFRSTTRRMHILIRSIDRLWQSFQKGTLRKVQEAPLLVRTHKVVDELSKAQGLKFDYRLHYTRGAIEELGGRLPHDATKEFIRKKSIELNDEHPPCYTTLYNWVKAYKDSGENPLSLMPSAHRVTSNLLYRQPVTAQEIIEKCLDTLYFIEEPHSKTDVIDAIKCDLEDLNEHRAANNKIRIMSTSTYYRIIQQVDTYERDLAQLGKHRANALQKWTRKTQAPLRILERIEADTQKVDIIVVNKKNEVLGRPYLTVLMCVKTRVIVGYDLSINPPCIEKTLRALKHSLRSNRDHNGLGRVYIMDGGSEFAGQKLMLVMKVLGSSVVFCEPYAPDQKPHVERWFKTLNTRLMHYLKGTTFSSPNDRGDYRSEEHAAFTLDELNEKLDEFLSLYHNDFHRELNTSPYAAWEKYSDVMNTPQRFSDDDIKRLCWSQTMAMPSKGGRITFEKLQWAGGGVPALATRSGKREKLKVFYDISDLGKVWICHPKWPDNKIEVSAVDPSYQQHLTLEMHHLVQKRLAKEAKLFNFAAARHARVKFILELHKTKTKSARLRLAKLTENKSTTLPEKDAQPTTKVTPVAQRTPVKLSHMHAIDVSSVVEKHDD